MDRKEYSKKLDEFAKALRIQLKNLLDDEKKKKTMTNDQWQRYKGKFDSHFFTILQSQLHSFLVHAITSDIISDKIRRMINRMLRKARTFNGHEPVIMQYMAIVELLRQDFEK